MVGKIALVEGQIAKELLNSPHSLRHQADFGCQYEDLNTPGPHKDGCGIAWVEKGRINIEKRAKKDAWDESFVAKVGRVRSALFLGHNRLASMGLQPIIDGSHPFLVSDGGKDFALCHNGSVRTFRQEAEARGTSDSRILLEHVIIPGQDNSPEIIRERVAKIAHEADYSSMSALLISNDELYAWRIFKSENEAETRERYYTLYLKQEQGACTVASEKLDQGAWELLPNGTFLRIARNGSTLLVERNSVASTPQFKAA